MSSVLSRLASNRQNVALTQWTKDQLISFTWSGTTLEKLALRGELTWSDQAVPLEECLDHLKRWLSAISSG